MLCQGVLTRIFSLNAEPLPVPDPISVELVVCAKGTGQEALFVQRERGRQLFRTRLALFLEPSLMNKRQCTL